MEQDLTLSEALAADRLDDFVQEVAMGAELVNGSELERALALLITRHRRAGIGTLGHSSTKLPKTSLVGPKHPDPV
jgi:hypothetical protein